ncbi:unnamed protein product [Dicrocoelium dendriticum]|nr:unnamed protein product [Dicrocoelium dendriticum]
MRWINRVAYGAGQMQKDVAGSVLNIFAILYFENCLGIQSVQVGTLWLCGQVMNAVSTPLVGFLSDHAVQKTEKSLHLKPITTESLSRKRKCSAGSCKRYMSLSNRKAWHLYGSLLMTISLSALFGQPEHFSEFPVWAKLLIVGALLIFIQVGWAAVQISHLTMINYLTSDPTERVLLISMRYLFASVADISTFIVSYVLLQPRVAALPDGVQAVSDMVPSHNSTKETDFELHEFATVGNASQFTAKDMPFFRTVSLVLTSWGLLFVLFFQFVVPERLIGLEGVEKLDVNGIEGKQVSVSSTDRIESVPQFIKSLDDFRSLEKPSDETCHCQSKSCDHLRPVSSHRENQNKGLTVLPLEWYQWFRQPRFWIGCFIFTTMRTSVMLSNFYLSPFLLHTLKMEKSKLALVPLVIYGTSMLTAVVQQRVAKLTGRLGNTAIGLIFTLTSCIMLAFPQPDGSYHGLVYSAAVVFGIGSAFNNVVAILVVTDIIGTNQVRTAAFVHGFTSLMDKVFSGLSVQLIQVAVPQLSYRHVQVYVAGGLLLVGGTLSFYDSFRWSIARTSEAKKEGAQAVPNTHAPSDTEHLNGIPKSTERCAV